MSGRPTVSKSSAAFFRASFLLTPASSSGKQILSIQVRCISRLNPWNIIVILRRRFLSSALLSAPKLSPFIRISPSVGRSSIFMQRTSVLFPAPLIPIMPYISPSLILSVTFFNASTVPPDMLKVFEIFLSWIIFIINLRRNEIKRQPWLPLNFH